MAEVSPFAKDDLHLKYFRSLQEKYGPDFSQVGLGISMWAKKDSDGKFVYDDVATFAANARRASTRVDVDSGMGVIVAMEEYTAKHGCIPRLMLASHGLGSNFGANGVAGIYPEGDGGLYLGERFKRDAIPGYQNQVPGGGKMPDGTVSARMGHWLRKTQLTGQIEDPQSKIINFFQTSATTDDIELRVKGSLNNYPKVILRRKVKEVQVREAFSDERGGLGRLMGLKKKQNQTPQLTTKRVEYIEPEIEYTRVDYAKTIQFCQPCIIQIHACSVSPKFGEEMARISGCQTVWATGKCAPVDFDGTGYDNGKMDYMWKADHTFEHKSVRTFQESLRSTPFFGNFLRATPDRWGNVKIEDAGKRYVADEYGVSPEANQIFDFERKKDLNTLIEDQSNPIINEKLLKKK